MAMVAYRCYCCFPSFSVVLSADSAYGSEDRLGLNWAAVWLLILVGQEAITQLEIEAVAGRVKAPLPGHVAAVQPVMLRLPLLHVAPVRLQG